MNSLVELVSTGRRTAVIHRKHDVPFLGHVELPQASTAQPAIGYQLRMRTAVHVHDNGVLLGRIEIGRKDDATVKVELAVRRFGLYKVLLPHAKALVGVLCGNQISDNRWLVD